MTHISVMMLSKPHEQLVMKIPAVTKERPSTGRDEAAEAILPGAGASWPGLMLRVQQLDGLSENLK